jgi:hypothetical protein
VALALFCIMRIEKTITVFDNNYRDGFIFEGGFFVCPQLALFGNIPRQKIGILVLIHFGLGILI